MLQFMGSQRVAPVQLGVFLGGWLAPWEGWSRFPSKRKRRLDSLEAAQGAPRDPRRDTRGERSPWLPLECLPSR